MTLLIIASAFVLGVALAFRFDLPLIAVGLLFIASAVAVAVLVNMRRPLMPAVFVLVLVLGIARVEVFERDKLSELVAYHSHSALVTVEGIVVSEPKPAGEFTKFRLRVEKIKQGGEWANLSGDVLVTLRESTELVRLREKPYFRYGDILSLEGRLEAPEASDEFDYPAYLERQGIDTVMSFPDATLIEESPRFSFYQGLQVVRHRLSNSLAGVVPMPEAALGQALLLGIRDNLPDDMVDEFQRTGSSHVLAISGLHVSILLGLTLLISQYLLGRRSQLYLLAPLILVWTYAIISGASPSVIRASIMGTVYLAALAIGRPRSTLPALGFAAMIMVMVSPEVIRSVSFQLSFTAMAGIAAFAAPVSERLKANGGNWPAIFHWLIDTTAMTIAATVATLPLVAFYFERVSLVGIPTTAMVLPAIPVVLVSNLAASVFGMFDVTSWLGLFSGWFAWASGAYLVNVVEKMASIPGASMETGPIAHILVWAYYAVLVLPMLARRRFGFKHDWRSRGPAQSARVSTRGVTIWLGVSVIVIGTVVWGAAYIQSDSRLRVSFVYVGQGDAAFIETPGGKQIVVDGGPNSSNIMEFLGDNIPVSDRTIDLVVLSHAHADHVTGLTEVLRRYDADKILEREIEYDSPAYEEWRRAVSREGAEVIQAQSGQVIDFGDGVLLHVVNPGERLLRGTESDTDNASVAIRLVYGDVSFLLTGGHVQGS